MKPLHLFTATVVRTVDHPQPRVELRIDGVSLIELIRQAERPYALEEGVPALAGNYGWPLLSPRLVRLLAGERRGNQRVQGVLVDCGCGVEACWPLIVRVRLSDRFVAWHDLRQAKRLVRWRYDALEAMRFAREPYLAGIAMLRDALSSLPKGSDQQTHPATGHRLRSDAASCAL